MMKILKSLLLTTFITTSIGTSAGASGTALQEGSPLSDTISSEQLEKIGSLLTLPDERAISVESTASIEVMKFLSPRDLFSFLMVIAGRVQNREERLHWFISMCQHLFGHTQKDADISTIVEVLSRPYTQVPLTEQHMRRVFNGMSLNAIKGNLSSFFKSEQTFQQKALVLRTGISISPVEEFIKIFKIFLKNSKKPREKDKLIETILSNPQMLQKLAQDESLLSQNLPEFKDMIMSRNDLWTRSRGWTASNMFTNLDHEIPDLQIFGFTLITQGLFEIGYNCDSNQLAAAKKLVALDKSKAIEACLSIATDLEYDLYYRLKATKELVALGQSKAIEVYLSIATDHKYVGGWRIAAAKELVALDKSKAIKGYLSIATNLKCYISYRLEAAKELVVLDKSKAIEAYMSIMTYVNSFNSDRFKAAKELVALDRSKAIEVCRSIATDLKCHASTRLKAAKELVALDKSKAIEVYMSIMTDHQYDALYRLVATKELVALDPSHKQIAIDTCRSVIVYSRSNPSLIKKEAEQLLNQWLR